MAIQDLTPQLRTRLQRVEKIVGFFVIFAALVLVVGFAYYLYHTAERKGWFIPKCPYFTFVQSAEGLKIGDPIVLMGFDVGKITVITAQSPAEHQVYVGIEVRKPYYGYIWTDSVVRVTAIGLLGGRGLEITPGVMGAPTVYEQGDVISELLIDGHKVPFTQAPKGVYLTAAEEPALSDRAQRLVGTVEQALPNILGLTNQLYTVLTNTAQLTANANQMVTNLTVITANLRDPHGSFGEWLIPGDLHTSVNTNLAAIAASLNDTILNLAAITSNLNAQVESNDKILTRISSLVVDTDNLVQGLKKHWLLRGVFQKMSSQTNAPPSTTPAVRPAEEKK
ncbi:MAG TPA: MlaD family protein [Verrucomicrobiae bacterium]|nr:MlaD family protein [Verrucomicrobiae bacterium]